MKRFVSAAITIVFLLAISVAAADPARFYKKDKNAEYHSVHLMEHLGSKNCKVSTNFVKIWDDASSRKVLGHLEQADTFTLDEIEGNLAKITVVRAAKTSKDSRDGLTGWVDANYVECPCSSDEYYNGPAHTTYSVGAAVKDGVNLREEPSKGSTLFASLQKGEQVEILSEYTGQDNKIWYRCRYEGKMGFIRSDMLNIVDSDIPEDLSVPQNISSSIDNGLWGDVHLNDAEIAGYVLSSFLESAPRLVNLGESSETFDEINSRYIFIGAAEFGYDLCIVIRVSDQQGYFWGLDLNPENLIKAKLVFEEDAPSCSLMLYEGKELKDSATYYKDFASLIPYDQFMEKVDTITSSLSSGDMSKISDIPDPILSCFPGISWDMTKNEVLDTIGKDKFTDTSSENGISLAANAEAYGDSLLIMFIFDKDGKLDMISAWMSDDNKDQFIRDFDQVYGEHVQTTYTDALLGKFGEIEKVLDGDSFAWKTDKSLIVLHDSSIEYWALY